MTPAINKPSRRPTSIFSMFRIGFFDAANILLDTVERADKARHQVMFAVLDNVRLNAEQTLRTSREILAAESISDAMKTGNKAMRSSIPSHIEQVQDVYSLIIKGGKTSVLPAQDYIRKLGR